MKNLTTLNSTVFLLLLVLLFAGCSDDPAPSYVPDDTFKPDTDITSSLRQYLENDKDISLDEGTFYVSESIIVDGFCGLVQGHPNGNTHIEVKEGFKATVDESLNFPNNKFTEIFAVFNAACDITFQNITFDIVGAAPAELHDNPWLNMVTTIDNVIVVSAASGADIMVKYSNLKIYGEQSTDPGAVNGRNISWPLIAVGPVASDAKIHLIIENCLINKSGNYAIEFWRSIGGFGEMTGNNIINSAKGIWLGQGMTATTVDISDNIFTNIDGLCMTNAGSATVCFMNNTRDGVSMADDCP